MTETFSIKLITPMFGGGYEAGKADDTTPIRPPSVRGQLRFWWRATTGAQFETTAALRQKEGEVWGTSSSPGKVTLRIEAVEVRPTTSSYRVFPFDQKDLRDTQPQSGTFNLVLRYSPALETEIRQAVWAWVNFGGLGSRTRRGCGALYCRKLAPTLTESGSLEWGPAAAFPTTRTLREWPTLPSLAATGYGALQGPHRDAEEAWKGAVGSLRDYRQGENIGRNRGQQSNRPGRSRWPEADSIRRLAGKAGSGKHGESITGEHNGFPRAEFGMPIIFELRGEHLKPTLQPSKESSRMSSPLLLRALAVNQAGKDQPAYMAMAMRLATPDLTKAVLKDLERKDHPVEAAQIRLGSRKDYRADSPLRYSPESGSALEAFMNYLQQERGFEWIT